MFFQYFISKNIPKCSFFEHQNQLRSTSILGHTGGADSGPSWIVLELFSLPTQFHDVPTFSKRLWKPNSQWTYRKLSKMHALKNFDILPTRTQYFWRSKPKFFVIPPPLFRENWTFKKLDHQNFRYALLHGSRILWCYTCRNFRHTPSAKSKTLTASNHLFRHRFSARKTTRALTLLGLRKTSILRSSYSVTRFSFFKMLFRTTLCSPKEFRATFENFGNESKRFKASWEYRSNHTDYHSSGESANKKKFHNS